VTSLYKDKDERFTLGKRARNLQELLASDFDLDGMDLRVYLYLSSRLEFDAPTLVQQNELAQLWDRKTTHISRAFRNLKNKGIILEGDKVGRSHEYRLNPQYPRKK
jgi:predicted transcriptional regulator